MSKSHRSVVMCALALGLFVGAMLTFAPDALAATGASHPAGMLGSLHLSDFAMATAGLVALPEEVKKSVDGLMTAFDEFKKTNDSRLAEIEKKGSADVVVTEKLARIEKTLDQFEAINQKLTRVENESKAAKEAADRTETKLGRIPGSAFQRREEQNDESKAAFDGFLRRGREGITADEVKVLRVSDDTAGGFLAPSDYVREIIKGVVEESPMRPLVRVRSTTLRSVQVPKRTGTFAARWVSEIGARSETQGLAYGLEEVPTHELTAEVYVSMQELEDSVFDIEAELSGEFTEQFGVAEGAAIVSGNGVGKPQGILANPDVGSINSGSATAVTADSVLSLYYGLKTAYARNGSFLLNRNTIGSIRKLKDTQNQYLWMPGLSQGVPNTINGATYTEVPDMPDEGAGAFPVAFGDFRRGYTLVDRLAISVLRDPFTKADVGQVKFVARRRLGGQVTLAEAIKLLKCSA